MAAILSVRWSKRMRDAEIMSQATRPSGLMGRMMGEIMALTNRPRNRWLIEQLDLCAGLNGLEFGFGNGETLTAFLQRTPGGQAMGIDWSQAMIDTAASRNKSAVAAGQLRLQRGDITDPALVLDQQYDRIWSSNVIQMIADRPALFARLHAALSEDGLLALCFQPRGPKAPPPRSFAPQCVEDLTASGFNRIETRWMPNTAPDAFCILARP
jgi:SAM-dependent methyltransferase